MKSLPPLIAAFLTLAAVPSQGASLTLAAANAGNVAATIAPDATEKGSVDIYMAALHKDIPYFRGPLTSDWNAYSSGTFPSTAKVSLTGKPITFTITNFDLSALPGLELYIGYGATEADLKKSGHVARVYTVPSAPPNTDNTTSFANAMSMNAWATGNLTFTGSFSPRNPRAGETVTFSFVKDDPDASIDYVCGYWDYGDPDQGYIDHINCAASCNQAPNPGQAFMPVHGHREWTTTYTYKTPGTYRTGFTTRSGDLFGCNPNGDDASLSLEVVVGDSPATPAITLLAGALGGAGNLDGSGSLARLAGERSIAIDRTGTLYLAGGARRITSAGVVTTAADDLPGAASGDTTMVFDPAGNAFRMKGSTLWQTTPSGVTSALAGSDAYGFADGTGSAARFVGGGLATDADGNIYIAEQASNVIRKVSPAGVATTLAGKAGTAGATDGVGTAAQFFGPRSLATDPAGNVYVGDKGNFTIRKITPAGVVTTFAGMPGESGVADGKGLAARFGSIDSMASDSSGNLYASAEGYCTIRKITLDGTVTTLAGTAWLCGHADGTGADARFGIHMNIATDAGGNLYALDQANFAVRKISPSGQVTTLAGNPPHPGSVDSAGTQARLNTNAAALAADAGGNIYFVDSGSIRKLGPSGIVSTLPGSAGSYYSGIAVDTAGYIYAPSYAPKEIRKISPDGGVSTVPGSSGMGAVAVAVDRAGNLYASDNDNTALRKISPDGVVSWFLRWADLRPWFDGWCNYNIGALTTDSAGNVYIAAFQTVFRITPGGAISLLAGAAVNTCLGPFISGAPLATGSVLDGVATDARFKSIRAIAADPVGNIYVADSNTARKISAAGIVTTIAGRISSVGVIPGPLPGSLNQPTGIAVLESKLVVLDEYSLLSIANP